MLLHIFLYFISCNLCFEEPRDQFISDTAESIQQSLVIR